MEDIKQIFANNLNQLMKQHGENLTQLSDAIDVAFSTVSSWKRGEKMPRSGALQKLAEHYHVNLTYLTSEHHRNNGHPTDLSVDEAIDGLNSYQGRPVSDDQKAIIKDLIKGYFDRSNKNEQTIGMVNELCS